MDMIDRLRPLCGMPALHRIVRHRIVLNRIGLHRIVLHRPGEQRLHRPGEQRLRRIAAGMAALALPAFLLIGCAAQKSSEEENGLALIQDVMAEVQESYVRPVGDDELVTDALKGMLTGLDPHSDYMTQSELGEMLSDSRGRFGGIGIEITMQDNLPQVLAPIDGTPAIRAGIQPGDIITEIEGKPTSGLALRDIVRILRGVPGTKVSLTIARKDRAPFPVVLDRAIIRIDSVRASLQAGGIGYARISLFGENTASELSQAIGMLRQRAGGRLNGFVLDLRNDPGGLLEASVDVASEFLDGGTVVTTRGRQSDENHVYTAKEGGDLLRGTPVVVLINSASASAAEIVAGALQDNHRGVLMGTRSFGKGSVQTVIPLEGRGALRLTTALYFTPAGRSIQGQGVSPDLVVRPPKEQQVPNAVVNHETDLRGALENGGSLDEQRRAPPALSARPVPDPDDRPINPTLIGTNRDAQLEAAVAYLRRHTAR